MFTKFFALLAIAAAANAGVIVVPEANIGTVPISKTTITGPSGEITQEEQVPVVSHETTLVQAPLAVVPETVVVPQEVESTVRLVQPIVHEEPIVRVVDPVVHSPFVPFVQPLVQYASPLQYSNLVVRTVPHTIPLVQTIL